MEGLKNWPKLMFWPIFDHGQSFNSGFVKMAKMVILAKWSKNGHF